MDLKKGLELITTILDKNNISYALIGGLALAARGIVRATQDIDFLIDDKDKDLLKRALQQNHFEIVHETSEVIQFKGPAFVDFLLAKRPLSRKMLTNATLVGQFPAKVIQLEDIIGLKIQAYKNDPSREFQDKADILSIMKQNEDLDFKKIKEYADLFDEWSEIESMKKKI